MNDNVIISRSLADHIEQVLCVSRLLYEGEVTFKQKKCKFFREKIDYPWHDILLGRFELSEHTTNAVVNPEKSTTNAERRSLLGLCSVFRRFVPNFTRIAAVFNQNLKKHQLKQFGPSRKGEYH